MQMKEAFHDHSLPSTPSLSSSSILGPTRTGFISYRYSMMSSDLDYVCDMYLERRYPSYTNKITTEVAL
jgi:hypothetical protein